MEITQANIRIDSALRAAVKIGALSSDEYDYACRIITAGEQRSVAAHPDHSGDGGEKVASTGSLAFDYANAVIAKKLGASKACKCTPDDSADCEYPDCTVGKQAAPIPQDGDERARFEAWWLRDVPEEHRAFAKQLLDGYGQDYVAAPGVADAWTAWKASAASLQAALASNKAAAVAVDDPVKAQAAFGDYRRGTKEAFHIANMINANRQGRTAEETCAYLVRSLAELANGGDAPAPIASAEEACDLQFPVALRKMWAGWEVQKWLDDLPPLYTHPAAAQPSRAEVLNTWQPIETAPKTGMMLLLGYPNALGKWRTVRGQWMSEAYIAENWEEPDDAEAGWYETSAEADGVPNCWPITPTHWMLLPAAPEVKP